MMLRYKSGEEIRLGDHVTFGGNAGAIGLVVVGPTGDRDNDWQFETNGAGVLVVEATPTSFTRVYLRNPETKSELLFVSRTKNG
jgi:hypothetical protein